MYLSHKGTFALTAVIFGLGLFITFLIPQNLGQPLTTGSQAQTAPNVPSNTNPGSVLVTPSSSAVDVVTCQMCDLDGSGVIDQTDIGMIQRALQQNPGNQKAQMYLNVCQQYANPSTPVSSCPGAGGTTGTTPVPPVGGGGGGTTNNAIGDCAPAGAPDGMTNILDFERLRQELAGEASTTDCDFDNNGSVDIIDFTDYLRKGLNS